VVSRKNARHATPIRSTLFIVGGNHNIGMEMWSYQAFGGTTCYLNKAKTLNLAAVTFLRNPHLQRWFEPEGGRPGNARGAQAIT